MPRKLTEQERRQFNKLAGHLPTYETPARALWLPVVAELRAMGFTDGPAVEGMPNSLTQYAFAVMRRAGIVDAPEHWFATMNPELLARADELAAKYHVRPRHALEPEVLKMLDAGECTLADAAAKLPPEADA